VCLSVLQISSVVERRLTNMFPWMEYVVRVGWLPDGNRFVFDASFVKFCYCFF